MPILTSDLTVGPSDVYWALFTDAAATEPASPNTALASAWTYVGGTDGGITFTTAQSYQAQYIDQTGDPLASALDTRVATAEFNMTRVVLENLKLLLNGGTITTAGSGATLTKKFEPVVDLVANDPVYSKILIRGKAPVSDTGFSGQKRDIFLRRVLQVNDVVYNTAKTDKSVFTASLSCHYVSSSIGPFAYNDMNAAA